LAHLLIVAVRAGCADLRARESGCPFFLIQCEARQSG
jgi:hypothetical protein